MSNPSSVSKRRVFISTLFHYTLSIVAWCVRQLPSSRRRLAKIRRILDVSYGPEQDHKIDLYLPSTLDKLHPCIFYIHGGGFRVLSKNTHWTVGLIGAENNFIVANVEYRKSPTYPCPIGLEDCAEALMWVIEHAHIYQIDPNQIFLAGESAGGSIIISLTIALSQSVCDSGPLHRLSTLNWCPKGVLPACAFVDFESLKANKVNLNSFIYQRLEFLIDEYQSAAMNRKLSDPMHLIKEFNAPWDAPPFLITVSVDDPIYPASKSLAELLIHRKIQTKLLTYSKGVHGFHIFIWSTLAQKCWQDQFSFMNKQLNVVMED